MPAALARGTLFARLVAGDRLSLPIGEVLASSEATLYLATSSEFISVAVLRGEISLAGRLAGPGEVLVRGISGSRIERFVFDASAFVAITPVAALNGVEKAGLEALARSQSRRLFWGGLQRTGFDVQTPSGAPMVEAVRRDYLLRPAVIAARAAAAGDTERLAREAADRFLAGLLARDVEVLEALLSPALFAADGRRHVAWLEARAEFARDLASGPLPAALAGATLGAGNLAEGFAVSHDRGEWRLRLQPLDTMVFVTVLEPGATPAEAGQ